MMLDRRQVPALTIDKYKYRCYYVVVMKHIINTIKDNYYRYDPGEFLPVWQDGKLSNRREFHMYRMKWLFNHYRVMWQQVTNQRG